MKSVLRALLRPRVIIPVTFSLAVLAALLVFGNVRAVLTDIVRFQRGYLLSCFLLLVAAEAGRMLLWHYLLTALGARVPFRAQLFSFLAGAITRGLPFGNYFPNYLLQRASGTDFGLTSAATLSIVLLEVTVTLTGMVILGLGSWTWLRPVILIGVPAFVLLVWFVLKYHEHVHIPLWVTKYKTLRAILDELRQFRKGARLLFHARILAIALLICAAYQTIAGAVLYFVVRGLGVDTVSFSAVLAAYFFSLAFALIEPSPTDVGPAEVGGAVALMAVGVSRAPAVSAMLISRMLSVTTTIIIGGIGMIFLRRELRLALHEDNPTAHSGAESESH